MKFEKNDPTSFSLENELIFYIREHKQLAKFGGQ